LLDFSLPSIGWLTTLITKVGIIKVWIGKGMISKHVPPLSGLTSLVTCCMTHSQFLEGLKCESKWKTAEEGGVGTRSLVHNTLRGRGACWSSRMGLGRIDKLIHSHGPAHNPHSG
jgi:hypothetical protein